jgi:tetratricopeptide (TPR) repeat protein
LTSTASPNDLFNMAREALDSGRGEEALDRLLALEEVIGQHVAVIHLQALALRSLQRETEADSKFLLARRIEQPPLDPYLFANHAALQEKLGCVTDADKSFDEAWKRAPERVDICMARIGFIHRQFGEKAAIAAYDELTAMFPDSTALRHRYALFLQNIDQTELALRETECVLKLNPELNGALHLKARLELDGGCSDAVASYVAAKDHDPSDIAVTQGLAAAIWHREGTESALNYLDTQLDQQPDWLDGWKLRARIAWQSGQAEEALAGYELACSRLAMNDFLWLARLQDVAKMQGSSKAIEVASQRANLLKLPPLLRGALAEITSTSGDFENADALFVSLDETQLPHISYIRHLIRKHQYEKALEIAERHAMQFSDMESWVYVWTLWRVTGDPRLDWLEAQGRLVTYVDLPDFALLQGQLAQRLRELHGNMAQHPFDQSPRGGTQTDGHLFARIDTEIVELRSMVHEAVMQAVAELPPVDQTHPFLSGPRQTVRYTGSWSIRLQNSGFHEAHYHNQGWMSSALYVALPDTIGATADSAEGWLEFGKPPDDLNLDLVPLTMIEPKVGRLALFPSILWHGTRPFPAGERLTVAFDILSVG